MKNKLLYFIPILLWLICYFVFSFDGLYGQDAYEYLRYSEALKTFLVTGKNPGDYFWGIYYPVFGSVLSFIIPNITLSLQLVSLLSLIVCSIYMEKIIHLIWKDNSFQNIPFLFFTLSPIVLIHSLLVMSDILTCCLITLAFYHLLRYLETKQRNTILYGVLFCILAVMTRYASAIILFPISCMVLFQLIKDKNFKIIFLSFFIILAVITPHIFIRFQNSFEFLSNPWLQNWSLLNLFEKSFYTLDGEIHNKTINFIYVFFPILHPIFGFLGGILIYVLIKYKSFTTFKYDKVIIMSIGLYALFLGGIPCQAKRFMLSSFPLVIIVLYPIIKRFFYSFKHYKQIFIALVFIQLTLSSYFFLHFYNRNKLEKTICNEISKYQGNTIYIFEIDLALKGRKLDFNYENLYFKKYDRFEKEALVLINEKQLQKQWKGKNPYINWENIQKKCVLVKLTTTYKDWNLYKISAVK